MAEGIVGGILGQEDDKPEVEPSAAPAGIDAFAAAVAARLAGGDPQVARRMAEFLERQSELADVQRKFLVEEHAARLHYLQGQAREVDPRRLGLRLRVGFQLFVVLAATAIGAAALIMVRDAVTSRRVVIEPFHAPPQLAAQGIDGAVVAAGVLDELARLQDSTRSSSAARGLTGAWTSDIKLDVPETGVSIGEISRLLRDRFGHDEQIDGALVQTAGGLALTVRGNNVPAKTFPGAVGELDALTTKAAEYVYSKSQPARWATYLVNTERYRDAVDFGRTNFQSVDPAERPRLLNAWALALQAMDIRSAAESLKLLQAAVRLQPDLWVAHVNVQNSLMILGDEEGAWRDGESMRRQAGGRPGRARETDFINWDLLTWNLPQNYAAVVLDTEQNGGAGTGSVSAGPVMADLQARMHDPDAAMLALETSKPDPHDPTIAAAGHFVRGELALDRGDTAAALTELEAFDKDYEDPAVVGNYPGYECWVALAEEWTGHPDKADAVLARGGTMVDCYRFRGDILDHRGDWPAAQKAYADAAALAPDLPAAYYSWGAALLRHGDFAAAADKFQAANHRGRHWADPLKGWGDALAKLGNASEALKKYDQALKLAPNWKALQAARAAASKT
ncbi:MAG TPA: tetratricopeptide repeat protein [Steroidobacteraceae bacterium]|jgi:tetratricopeptide (TPR) repeat protein|nr:tetratricopeptide repeat protein [Steroidobacteraceae bacterium]